MEKDNIEALKLLAKLLREHEVQFYYSRDDDGVWVALGEERINLGFDQEEHLTAILRELCSHV